MKNTIKIVLIILMLTIFIAGAYMLFLEKEEKQDQTEIISSEEGRKGAATVKVKEAELPVTVLRIKRSDLPLRLPISATADVWEGAVLKAEVSGTVDKIYPKIGSKVNRGQLLVKIDDTEKKLAVERAQANKLTAMSKYLISNEIKLDEVGTKELTQQDKDEIKNWETKYADAVKQFQQGKLSEIKMDEINEAYQEFLVYKGVLREQIRMAVEGLSDAKVGLKMTRLDLNRCSIKSPFPGIVSELKVSAGEKIGAGQDLLKVVNLQSIYLKGFALESEVSKLIKGTAVRIKFDSFPDKHFYGQIQSISPEIDPQNKTINIFIDVDNKDELIMPGMHAEIDVEYKVFKDVLKVPRVAVIQRQRPLVFAVRGDMAEWIYVELGEKNDENQIINTGLKDGDLIVIDGHLTLAHQSKVKIIKTLEQE